MKLFICWSGPRSEIIAQAMRDHLPSIIPGLQPFKSSDIPKGARWFNEVAAQLHDARAGLICLTPENVSSPWIHFEAGALAKQLDDNEVHTDETMQPAPRIFTYLYGMEPAEISGPLDAYQSTVCEKDETKRLIIAIAKLRYADEDTTTFDDWRADFDTTWKKTWTALAKDMQRPLELEDVVPDFTLRFARKTYNEPLDECTAQDWIRRYNGARETYAALQRDAESVRRHCRPYIAALFDTLIAEADGYAMDMSALLLDPKKFGLTPEGRLDVDPPGIKSACERRRSHIKNLVAQLLDSSSAPVIDEAWQYKNAGSFQEKKVLIHRKERELARGDRQLHESTLRACLDSTWDFDRIVYYLAQKYTTDADAHHLIACVRMELERLRASTKQGSLVPLHYAIDAIDAVVKDTATAGKTAADIEHVLTEVQSYIDEPGTQRDSGGQLRRNIGDVLRHIETASVPA